MLLLEREGGRREKCCSRRSRGRGNCLSMMKLGRSPPPNDLALRLTAVQVESSGKIFSCALAEGTYCFSLGWSRAFCPKTGSATGADPGWRRVASAKAPAAAATCTKPHHIPHRASFGHRSTGGPAGPRATGVGSGKRPGMSRSSRFSRTVAFLHKLGVSWTARPWKLALRQRMPGRAVERQEPGSGPDRGRTLDSGRTQKVSSADGINAAQARRGRELLNWSETDLAVRANVDARAIRGFEDGSYPPSPEQRRRSAGRCSRRGCASPGGADPGAALRSRANPTTASIPTTSPRERPLIRNPDG